MPGDSSRSVLIPRIASNQLGPQMPPTGALSPSQIDIIKRWIDEGAVWPDDVSGDVPGVPPDPTATRMMDALRLGDRATFTRLLNTSPEAVNRKGPGGSTPLMFAALYGDAATVRTVLEKGADPNTRNERGATALMWAVTDAEKTRLLLAKKSDPNLRSNDGRTALLIASLLFGSNAVVKQLLDSGADVAITAVSLFGPMNPLTAAASVGNEAVMRMLIQHGANPKSTGFAGLSLATKAECSKCVELLLEHTSQQDRNIAATILNPPFGTGHNIPMFLSKGVDVNAKDREGRSLLLGASASDTLPVESIKMLIDRGADLSAKGPKGETALDMARQRGNTPVVDLLVKAGAKEGLTLPEPKLTVKPAASARVAVERVLPLLQRADVTFLQRSGCVSCHHNTFVAMAVSSARAQKISVDETTAQKQLKVIAGIMEGWRERLIQGIGIPGDADTISYILIGLAAEKFPADAATDALAYFIKNQQSPNGQWRILAHRPPIESSDIEVTAASLRAMKLYAPKPHRAEYEKAALHAVEWLKKAQPQSNEERAFQIMGLVWGGVKASDPLIKNAVAKLVAEQRPDGGWAQIPSLSSDSYATGQTLVALREAGVASAPAYQKGVRFLLNTQLDDGSWYVKSRAIPIQPLFDGGFPHGRDQWISAAGSSWAALALSQAAQ